MEKKRIQVTTDVNKHISTDINRYKQSATSNVRTRYLIKPKANDVRIGKYISVLETTYYQGIWKYCYLGLKAMTNCSYLEKTALVWAGVAQ